MTMRLVIVSIGDKTLVGARQGFIDQHGTFYTREDAWRVAVARNQILRDLPCGGGILFSEHLY